MPNILDGWSLMVSPLIMKCNGHSIGTATGFFWKEFDKTYLVTNWHVLSGRKPITKEPINKDCALPDQIIYKRFIEGESYNEVIEDGILLQSENEKFQWLEHPAYGSRVDVGAIEVPAIKQFETVKGQKNTYVNSIPNGQEEGVAGDASWHGHRREMGSDVFVLGFPLDQRPTGHFPIWKRASIATEMDIGLDGKPAFLIDTATREGMSGSPVISLDLIVISRYGPSKVDRHHHFLGVYSGRHIGRTPEEVQLGIVWRQGLIRDIICGQQLYQWP
jgi:hypothetical protein